MIQKIKDWLNNPNANYQEGLEYYNKFKHTDQFDNFFARVHNQDVNTRGMEYNMLKRKLAEIYRKLLANPPKKMPVEEKEIQVQQINLNPAKQDNIRSIEELIDKFNTLDFAKLPYGELKSLSNRLAPELGKQPKGKFIIKKLNEIKTNKDREDLDQQQEESNFDLIDRPVIRKPQNEVNYEDLPEEMKARFDENKELTIKMGTLHAKAKALGEDGDKKEERAKFMEELLQLDDKRAENWQIIDSWWANRNNEPVNDTTDPVTRALELEKKIDNLKTNISRTKTKIKKNPEDKKVLKWKDKVSAWTKDIALLEGELVELKNKS